MITVYRKSSASDRYIHYTSWQPWKEKAGAIRTLKNRAHTYCSDEYLLAEELSYLLGGFLKNGYPEKVVYRILYEEMKTTKQQQQGDKATDFANVFYVPYHSRAKRLYNILREQFGITTIFKKTTTLGNLIRRKGRQKEKQFTASTVYKVPCKECDKAYIGQSKNTIAKRVGQHKALCRRKVKLSKLKNSKKDNGIAFHHIKTGHEFDFDNAEIIARETNYWRRLILEGIAIKAHDNLVNLQAGYMIDECWTPYLARQGGANQMISDVSG